MRWFDDLRGNLKSIKEIVNADVKLSYDRTRASKLIEKSLSIVSEIEKHEKFEEELHRGEGSVDD